MRYMVEIGEKIDTAFTLKVVQDGERKGSFIYDLLDRPQSFRSI